MTLDIPILTSRLCERVRAETARILRRIDRMRIEEIRPFLLSRTPPAKVAIEIEMSISAHETLRKLRFWVADPKGGQVYHGVPIFLFGKQKPMSIAIESRAYISFVGLVLARRHPNGRPFYTAPDQMLEDVVRPDLRPLKVADRLAGLPDPEGALRRYYSVVYAWQELERRRDESYHARIARLAASRASQD